MLNETEIATENGKDNKCNRETIQTRSTLLKDWKIFFSYV